MTAVIDAQLVKTLREKTNAGLMECKRALGETNGDLEAAVDLLRKKGAASAAKKADREAKDGTIAQTILPGAKVGVLVEVNCETDFVARTDEFAKLVRDLALQACAGGAEFVRSEEVPAARIEKEKEIFRAQMEVSGKPANIIEKIVEGKVSKFFSEICLLDQPFIKDDKMSVQDLVTAASAKTGENIVVRRFVRFQLGQE